jgi:predicted dehydrogenase
MNPIHVVVVGCGAAAELNHLPSLCRLEAEGTVTVVGLVDPDTRNLQACKRLAPSAATYASLPEALDAIRPDLLVVTSPAGLHAQHTLEALSRGIHVLCEKPMAVTVNDAARMVEEANRRGLVLGIGLLRRFYPSIQAIRSLIHGSVLGAPVSFTVNEGGPLDWPIRSASSFRRSESGGGVLADAGPHTLDILAWWFGELRILDYADDAIDGVEANCRIDVSAFNGVNGTVQITRETRVPNRYLIRFERGWVAYEYDVPNQILWGWDDTNFAGRVTLCQAPTTPMWSPLSSGDAASSQIPDYYRAEHQNVIAAIRGHEELLVSPEEALRGIRLIEGCYEKRRLLDMPWLDGREADALAQLAVGINKS